MEPLPAYEAAFHTATARTHASIAQLRRRAFDRFLELGIPTPENEQWKYTNVSELARRTFCLPKPEADGGVSLSYLQACHVPVFESPRVVFVNGVFAPRLSTQCPPGIAVQSLAQVLETKSDLQREVLERLSGFDPQESFAALNTALAADGAVVVFSGEHAEPLQLIFIHDATEDSALVSPRALIFARPNSRAAVVESHLSIGDQPTLANSVTDIVVSAGAKLEHTKLQRENASSYHIGRLQTQLATASSFTANVFHFGGAKVRHEVHLNFAGEASECFLNGLTTIGGKQHVDNHTVIDHAKPHCFSREVYKGIYDQHSNGVFSGTIIVRPGAQKTNAIQQNQSILLSPDANVDTRPQLKIWADDVKCTHGATVGQIDEDALFYIRSRGIAVATARQLLIHAFASEVINHVASPTTREYLERMLMVKLGEN